MLACLIRGILIGLIFGVPVGAVGVMTAQRTISYGNRAGLVTGLGSSTADSIYAIIGAFGLSVVSDFLLKYQIYINIVGGAFILFLGLRLLLNKKASKQTDKPARADNKPANRGTMFLSAFAVGITNPAAILSFLFAFSWFGIQGDLNPASAGALAAGVFIGTYLWWIALTLIAGKFKEKAAANGMKRLHIISGTALMLFAAVIFTRLIINL